MVAPNYVDICEAPVQMTERSMALSWAAGYIEGVGAFSGPNARLHLPAAIHAPVANSSAARELCMLFPRSRILPQTVPAQWVVTGPAAIMAMQELLPYLRISGHAVAVFL